MSDCNKKRRQGEKYPSENFLLFLLSHGKIASNDAAIGDFGVFAERGFFCTAKMREHGGNGSAGVDLFLLIVFIFALGRVIFCNEYAAEKLAKAETSL